MQGGKTYSEPSVAPETTQPVEEPTPAPSESTPTPEPEIEAE